MTHAETTKAFFNATTRRTVNMVLDHIAAHYGCDRAAAHAEVTHDEAHNLLDYMTEPARTATMIMLTGRGLRPMRAA
jgi:hypothetical protein